MTTLSDALEAQPPKLSPAEYREALFAAREARKEKATLQRMAHSSGPSRRVRRWQSNQKDLRRRAERRVRKYASSQSVRRSDELADEQLRNDPELGEEAM